MSLPLDKLLQENNNRYKMCTAAIRVSQKLSNLPEHQWQERGNDKIAILSMEKVLNGEAKILPMDDEELLEGN